MWGPEDRESGYGDQLRDDMIWEWQIQQRCKKDVENIADYEP